MGIKEIHEIWVETQMTEHVYENDDGTLTWEGKTYATESELDEALWSSSAITESFGSAVDDAVHRVESYNEKGANNE